MNSAPKDSGSKEDGLKKAAAIPGAFSTAPLGANRQGHGSDGLSLTLKEFVDKAFFTLKTIVQSGNQASDLFIALMYPDRPPRIEWASGQFSPHLSRSLSVDSEPLKSFALKPQPVLHPDTSRIKGAESLFLSLPAGALALVPFDLTSEIIAVIGFWQPPHIGRITNEKFTALRLYAETLEQAAAAPDLSQDVQTQQMRLDLIHEEIAEMQQFYSQFSESMSQCFWVGDLATSQTVLVSDNFENVWGTARDCLQNGMTGFVDTVLPEDRDRVLADFHLSLGQSLDTEFRVVDSSGELRWIWLRSFKATPDRLSSRTTERLVLIADNITEKKTHEEILREREAQFLSRSQASAIGDLASGVAHEINNPLTVIIGKAGELKKLAEKNQLSKEKVIALTDKIESTSIRVSEIISSLKALARQDKTQGVFKTSFKKLFSDLSDVCTERFKAAGVVLEIPEIPEPVAIDMNATLIMQMFLNLMNNAYDAVQAEKHKWVKVEFIETDHEVFFYVTDSGPGIPIKIRSRIFDPFFTTKDRGKGTGLGLSLAQTIAFHHNGSLRLDNLSQNTRFVVQLPKKLGPGIIV